MEALEERRSFRFNLIDRLIDSLLELSLTSSLPELNEVNPPSIRPKESST